MREEVEETVVAEGITLQLLKADEEAGVTVENSEVYQELESYDY